jgi:hypothetical protein
VHPLHCRDIDRRQGAGKGFDHHESWFDGGEMLFPWLNLDAILSGCEQGNRVRIINPQPYMPTVLDRELLRQPPADPRIAKVVDNGAEDVA